MAIRKGRDGQHRDQERTSPLSPSRFRAVQVFGKHHQVVHEFERDMRGVAVLSDPEHGWFCQTGLAPHAEGWKGRAEVVALSMPDVSFAIYTVDGDGSDNRATCERIQAGALFTTSLSLETGDATLFLFESTQAAMIEPDQWVGVIVEVDGNVIAPAPICSPSITHIYPSTDVMIDMRDQEATQS